MNSKFEQSTQYIKEKIGAREPKLAIILGSGLGVLVDEIENAGPTILLGSSIISFLIVFAIF